MPKLIVLGAVELLPATAGWDKEVKHEPKNSDLPAGKSLFLF
jgi:hypothetical protein